ncbi:MAG: FAD-dependent oxidoreductase [Thermoproteota archaeon]
MVVVGGGAVGLTSAVLMAERGFRVTLLESREVFGNASGASLGILSKPLALLDGIEKKHAEKAISLHKTMASRHGYTLAEAKIATPLREYRAILREIAAAPHRALLVRFSISRIPELGFSLVLGGTLLMDPLEYRDALLEAAEGLGIDVRTRSRVVGFVASGGRCGAAIVEDGERVAGDAFVVAAGPWTDELLAQLGVRLGVEPLKGYTLVARTDRQLDMVIGVDPVYVRPHQRLNGTVMVGGFKLHTASLKVDETHVRAMVKAAERVGVKLDEVLEVRTGLRPCLEKPLVAPIGASNVIAATGHCRHGMLLAPLAAEQVLKAVEGLTSTSAERA